MQASSLPGDEGDIGEGKKGKITRNLRKLLGMMDMSFFLVVMMVSWV